MFAEYFPRIHALGTSLISLVLTIKFTLFFGAASENASIESKILMIAVGIYFDSGKCWLWFARRHSIPHVLFASALTLLSCAASVTFCILDEDQTQKIARQDSAAYANYMEVEQELLQQIALKKALYAKYLSSQYHDQWKNAEAVGNKLNQLYDELKHHRKQKGTAGLEEARRSTQAAIIFDKVSDLTGWSYEFIKNGAYLIFSILLELLPIFMLTGVKTHHRPAGGEGDNCSNEAEDSVDLLTQKITGSDIEVKRAVIQGEVKPVAREVSKKYGLPYYQAKGILQQLEKEGYLSRCGNYFRVVVPVDQQGRPSHQA